MDISFGVCLVLFSLTYVRFSEAALKLTSYWIDEDVILRKSELIFEMTYNGHVISIQVSTGRSHDISFAKIERYPQERAQSTKRTRVQILCCRAKS